MRLVATDADGKQITSTAGTDTTADQRILLPLNRNFIIQVQNLSRRPLHLAVLDLQSTADVSQVWPAAGSTAQDNIIQPTPPGKWQTLWVSGNADTTQTAVFQATSVDPDEFYKAVATIAADRQGGEDEYIDFTPLTTRGASRGPVNPFSDLFGHAVDAGVRGTAMNTKVDPGTWTAYTLPFQVR